MRYILSILLASLLATSAIAGLDWQVAKIGGAESEQGPYGGGAVEFIGDDGFTITAKCGDIRDSQIGCMLAYIKDIVGDFTIQYTIEEDSGKSAMT